MFIFWLYQELPQGSLTPLEKRAAAATDLRIFRAESCGYDDCHSSNSAPEWRARGQYAASVESKASSAYRCSPSPPLSTVLHDTPASIKLVDQLYTPTRQTGKRSCSCMNRGRSEKRSRKYVVQRRIPYRVRHPGRRRSLPR